MKYEKDIDRRILAEETKSNLKNMKQDMEKSRLILREHIRKMKKDILKAAETKPEILQIDKVLYEKLKYGECMEELLKTYTPNIIDDMYFDKPELNQLFLDYDENSDMSICESYFMKVMDEDKLRYEIHLGLAGDFEKIYDEDIDDMVDYNEIHIGNRTKKHFEDYFKIIKTDEFREYSTSYAKTEDNYRVDLGLVISRKPIFFG